MQTWESESPDVRAVKFAAVATLWERANSDLARLSRVIRYLEEWIPQLERQWDQAKTPPASYLVIRDLSKIDAPETWDELREGLRPRRVIQREYLPEKLSGRVRLPIATDIADKKFLAEVEGALETHWNDSPWAKSIGVRFRIQWTPVPRDLAFAAGKATLHQHLEQFPKGSAILTTGGLTPHVSGRALVLGPGKINPRTISHELGHLLGFGDCYMRTLSSQSVFGLGVLEWDNPLYPDDLMCDNTVGVARAEAW
jgi:hypothetical protein